MTKSCRRLQYEPGVSILEQRLAGRALVRLVRKGIQRLLVACPACYREAVVLYSAQPLFPPNSLFRRLGCTPFGVLASRVGRLGQSVFSGKDWPFSMRLWWVGIHGHGSVYGGHLVVVIGGDSLLFPGNTVCDKQAQHLRGVEAFAGQYPIETFPSLRVQCHGLAHRPRAM